MSADRARVQETQEKIARATGVFAVERSTFYREHLARLMRRAIAQGVRRERVIALSALPVEEAEGLLQ